MFSHRVPSNREPNAWSARLDALRAGGAPLADLTESNPTRTGLAPLAEAAAILARVPALAYVPEPRGLRAARAAVAASFDAAGIAPRADDVVLTASTSDAYGLLFQLLLDPGECVLAPAPSYPLLEPLARAHGVRLASYPLRFDGAWHLDRDALVRAAEAARALVLVEPNHPTGSCLEADDRAFVTALAAERGLALVADEVFGDHPQPPHAGPLPTWLGTAAALTFVLGGLSKRCGLPHLKLGWIVACGPVALRHEALARLEWLADLALGVAAPVQHALPELLALRHGFAAAVRGRMAANLAALVAFVAAQPACTRLPASGGWSAVLRVPAVCDDEAWTLALLERGVVVHPGHFYDFGSGTYLVVSLIVEPATFAAGLAALAAELDARGAGGGTPRPR